MPALARPRIKMCGITRVEDAQQVLDLGVDALGLVFYRNSPRAVAVADAAAIAKTVGPFVTVVGLFVDAPAAEVDAVLREVPLQVLQFHGDETAEYCQQFQRPWIKALRMAPGLELQKAATRFAGAGALLLDSYKPGVPGGTGETFDWSRATQQLARPIILAGGLTPANVGEAIRTVRPYAVDVSGGVESAPGIKDAQKMREFVEAVKLEQCARQRMK